MVDAALGVGLASSILTLLSVSYKVSKKTLELSKVHGQLLPGLQECSDLMKILARTARRLQDQLKTETPVIGPVTALHTDLRSLFEKCNETASDLLSLLDKLQGSNPLSTAIKVTGKESQIRQIRNQLDSYILALLLTLEERQQTYNKDLGAKIEMLKAEFYQFHEDLVDQMSRGFQQVKTSIRDSKQSLKHDLRPPIDTNSQAISSSQLSIINGQQDLLQNLLRMEQSYISVLANGGDRLTSRLEERVAEQHATTRALFQSAFKRQDDDLRAQTQLLHQEVTRVLHEIEIIRKASSVTRSDCHLRIQASFEFDIRSDFVTIHIGKCVEWVSTTISLPPITNFVSSTLSVPIPYLSDRHEKCSTHNSTSCSTSLNFMLKQSHDEYHLVKIDLPEQSQPWDVSKAAEKVYKDHRGPFWRFMSFYKMSGISYVKYKSSLEPLQSFTDIQEICSDVKGVKPCTAVSKLSSGLPLSLEFPYEFRNGRSFDLKPRDSCALLIKERLNLNLWTSIEVGLIIRCLAETLRYLEHPISGMAGLSSGLRWFAIVSELFSIGWMLLVLFHTCMPFLTGPGTYFGLFFLVGCSGSSILSARPYNWDVHVLILPHLLMSYGVIVCVVLLLKEHFSIKIHRTEIRDLFGHIKSGVKTA